MADDKNPRKRRSWRAATLSALVLALSGLLLTTSAHLARTSGTARHPENVLQLVHQRSRGVAALTDQVTELSNEVQRLTGEQVAQDDSPTEDQTAVLLATGALPVTGPGIEVTLSDAQTDQIPPGAVADDLVVHQQDIQAVMNALWLGGAEAMTIQGRRVTSTSAVRCVGNVLYLQGQIYSPPYQIAAIGDPGHLRSAIDTDQRILNYLEYVAAYGLGWDVVAQDRISMPASEGVARPKYAEVIASIQLGSIEPGIVDRQDDDWNDPPAQP